MRRTKKIVSMVLLVLMFASIMSPEKVKADSSNPNLVTTDVGYEMTSTVDVNFNAGSIQGLVGRSPLSDFRKAIGLTQEEIEMNYYPVVYTHESSLDESITDALRAKATEIGAERIVTFIDIFLFKQTMESTLISSYPNYVEYIIKLPSALDSSDMEYAMISYYDGRMQLFKDVDDDYSTLAFSTNKSSAYALVRAWDGAFDNIENGAYIDGTAIAETEDSELDDVPKTGEPPFLLYFSLIAIISGATYIYLNKKEKKI